MGLIYHRSKYLYEDDLMLSQEILLNGSFDKWVTGVHSAYEIILQPNQPKMRH